MMSADVSTPCDSPASSTAAAAATSPSSYVPERMERHLQSVDMSASGRMLLGATSLSSEHWTGSLWLFDDPSAAPDLRRCLTGLDLEDGLCEALFLDGEGEQVAAAMQSGAVEFYKLSVSDEDPKAPSFRYLERTTSVREHDDAITAMRIASGGNALLTASYDRSVVCLDSATTAVKRRWDRAHDDVILDLVTEGSSNLFATAAQDGRVALWDDRENKCQKCEKHFHEVVGVRKKHYYFPFSGLYKDLDAAPSCLAWSPINKDRLVVGDVSGRLLVLDSRQMADPLNIVKVSQQRIYKIKFSTHK